MITGVHAVMLTSEADGLRAFLRDVLGLDSVDAGGERLADGVERRAVAALGHVGDGEQHAQST